MPMYEYKCNSCEHVFKAIKSVATRKEPEAEPCPECKNQESVTQMIGCPNIVAGVVGAAGIKKPQWFQDKIKELKKHAGKDNTLDRA